MFTRDSRWLHLGNLFTEGSSPVCRNHRSLKLMIELVELFSPDKFQSKQTVPAHDNPINSQQWSSGLGLGKILGQLCFEPVSHTLLQ